MKPGPLHFPVIPMRSCLIDSRGIQVCINSQRVNSLFQIRDHTLLYDVMNSLRSLLGWFCFCYLLVLSILVAASSFLIVELFLEEMLKCKILLSSDEPQLSLSVDALTHSVISLCPDSLLFYLFPFA